MDLTQDYLKPLKINVDTEKFNELTEKRKSEARKSWKGSGSESVGKIWYELKDKYGSTEFVGYSTETTEAKIISIIDNEKEVNGIKSNHQVSILTNQTCFYAESGGQVGDRGYLKTETGTFEVKDTQKFFGSLFVHIGVLKDGFINVDQDSTLEIEKKRRSNIKSNHSATHLLHAALREELGNHVAQKGSYVGPDYLRFDFSHSKQISDKEINKINQRVNYFISKNDKVMTRLMSPEKAIKEGAMALFGEKYGDEVRVVSMGKDNNNIFSLELCGGTHVERTGEIGEFSVINESSISSGVRRIEALRGTELKVFIENKKKEQDLKLSENQKKLDEIVNQIKELNGDYKKFQIFKNDKQINEALSYLNDLKVSDILSDKTKNIINSVIKKNININTQILIGLPSKEIRNLVDKGKKNKENVIIFIISLDDKKTSIGVGVSDSLTDKYNATDLVKKISLLLGGKGGGGRKDFAQSGGGESTIELVESSLKKIINEI